MYPYKCRPAIDEWRTLHKWRDIPKHGVTPLKNFGSAVDPEKALTIHVALKHVTQYNYDRLVSLSAQVLRLRPAPHSRTPSAGLSPLSTPPARDPLARMSNVAFRGSSGFQIRMSFYFGSNRRRTKPKPNTTS